MENNKTIITIEKEPVYIDGILHYKRTLKKNDKIICDETIAEDRLEWTTPKISMFMDWVEWLENNKDGEIGEIIENGGTTRRVDPISIRE